MSRVVDGVLKEWGERLFYEPVKGKKGRNVRGGASRPAPSSKPHSSAMVKDRLARTIGKAPEVMVKIPVGEKDPATGKHRPIMTNMGAIKAHFDYISRNGDVELEDENGAVFRGSDDVYEVRDAWAKGKIGIPLTNGRRREAFNIILSMPPGTDRKAVKDAARQFAAEQFGNHQYVFAAHEDEDHPHVHLAVKAVDKSGVRMSPRKADLQAWREHFADKLREQGVAANATPRRVRGVVRKAEKQAVYWIDKEHQEGKRGAPSKSKAGRSADVAREVAGEGVHVNPAAGAIAKARQETVLAYGKLAKALARSPVADDQRLALGIVDFVKAMPPQTTQHEAAVALARQGERGQGDSGRDLRQGPERAGRPEPDQKER